MLLQLLVKILEKWLLVDGIPTPLKNDGVRQWVSDDIPYV